LRDFHAQKINFGKIITAFAERPCSRGSERQQKPAAIARSRLEKSGRLDQLLRK
jgi:hypothetical protein